MLTKKILPLVCMVVNFVSAQVLEDSPCLDLPAVEKFDEELFKGTWIARVKTDSEGDVANTKCVRYLFNEIDDDVWHTAQQVLNISDDSIYEYQCSVTIEEPGVLVRESDKRRFTVIGTDYEDFAVIYGCKDVGNSSSVTIHILSRDEGSEKAVTSGGRLLINHGISFWWDLRVIDQNNCPKDWSDPIVIERNL